MNLLLSVHTIPINKGFEVISTGWNMLKTITFSIGSIEITLAQIFIGLLFVSLAGFLIRVIFLGD